MTLDEALALRVSNPDEYVRRSVAAMGQHVEAMLALKQMGAVTFDYGNNIRTQAKRAGVQNAFDIPGFVPEYIRPLFCEGRGPFRWVALSGSPADIHATDQLALELFPNNAVAAALDAPGARTHPVSRIARAHLLAGLRRARRVRPGA